jgi:hypothetical protein
MCRSHSTEQAHPAPYALFHTSHASGSAIICEFFRLCYDRCIAQREHHGFPEWMRLPSQAEAFGVRHDLHDGDTHNERDRQGIASRDGWMVWNEISVIDCGLGVFMKRGREGD